MLGGFLLARFLVFSGFSHDLVSVVSTGLPKGVVIITISLMYLVLGCLMDTPSMMITTIPFIYPLVTSIGFDGIWFGVFFTKLAEISVLTPPVGMNLFVVAAAAGEGTTVGDVIKGVVPFILMDTFVLILLALFPGISLFLPSTMY
ncbi:TRAP transporter large permease subunit [Thermodesulfobacteriota bacterium]